MTVQQLIQLLETLPHYAETWALWDGASRSQIDHAWLSKDGKVILGEKGSVVYYDEDRPLDAPTEKQDSIWRI